MQAGSSPSSPHRMGRVVAYTTVTVVAAGVVFVWLLFSLPATEPSAAGTSRDDVTLRGLFARTAAVMFVAGLMVFFLLLGGAMTLNIGAREGSLAWASLLGRMPYIAFSLLAG